MAWSKDIFFSFSLSGAASRLFVFLCALSDLRGEQKKPDGYYLTHPAFSLCDFNCGEDNLNLFSGNI